ncbi:MAG TPA: amidase [Terriglobia bacterium]|nr:amidase [Terriglobia bacterium]
MIELHFLSAAEMAAAVRGKQISPRELVTAHLDRMQKLNSRLNALIHIDREGALRAADEAGRALLNGPSFGSRTNQLGPLHGVPITIKSSIDVAGWPCESGTRLRAGRVASSDAPLVERLRKAGAILLGSTNTPELLMAYETDNVLNGRTNSPWDPARTPGGSSGGEAAAIAAGLSAGGVGSDGGGSIRVPAHYSGICGLKPTPGRIPTTGHFPGSTGPFALIGVVGPMARTARDLEILFEVMAGPDDGDPSSAPVPMRWPDEAEARQLRVGVFEEGGGVPASDETRGAVRQAAEWLRLDGYAVEPFTPLLPGGLERARELWCNVFVRAGAMILNPMVRGREAEISPILREFLGIAAKDGPLNGEELLETWLDRDKLRGRLLAEMQRYPVLICPVCSIPAFQHGERQWQVGGRKLTYLDAMSYTQWFNILGNPAAVVPVGQSAEGLPIGVQVVGRPYEEERVLVIARAIERLRGPWRPPPLA